MYTNEQIATIWFYLTKCYLIIALNGITFHFINFRYIILFCYTYRKIIRQSL